jgi:hypothetical protein
VSEGAASQSSEIHSQSEQVAPVGPDEVPARQVLVVEHQPQPARAVHVSQPEAEHVGVEPPLHVLGRPRHVVQLPELGPALLPALHPPLPSAHQPQPRLRVHWSHVRYPHSVVTPWHVPPLHASEPVHRSPVQHGCPSAPQPAGV